MKEIRVYDLPEDVHKELKVQAALRGETLNSLLNEILWNWTALASAATKTAAVSNNA